MLTDATSYAGAKRKKVRSDLKQEFITLAWPELQNPPCSGHGVPHAMAETLEGACPWRRM